MFLLSLINLIDSYELNNHYYRNSISKWADFINVQRKMFKNLSFMNFRFFNNDNFCFDPIFNYLLSHKKKENKNICIYTSKRNVKLLCELFGNNIVSNNDSGLNEQYYEYLVGSFLSSFGSLFTLSALFVLIVFLSIFNCLLYCFKKKNSFKKLSVMSTTFLILGLFFMLIGLFILNYSSLTYLPTFKYFSDVFNQDFSNGIDGSLKIIIDELSVYLNETVEKSKLSKNKYNKEGEKEIIDGFNSFITSLSRIFITKIKTYTIPVSEMLNNFRDDDSVFGKLYDIGITIRSTFIMIFIFSILAIFIITIFVLSYVKSFKITFLLQSIFMIFVFVIVFILGCSSTFFCGLLNWSLDNIINSSDRMITKNINNIFIELEIQQISLLLNGYNEIIKFGTIYIKPSKFEITKNILRLESNSLNSLVNLNKHKFVNFAKEVDDLINTSFKNHTLSNKFQPYKHVISNIIKSYSYFHSSIITNIPELIEKIQITEFLSQIRNVQSYVIYPFVIISNTASIGSYLFFIGLTECLIIILLN